MTTRKSAAVPIGILAATAVLTGCGSDEPQYQGVCIDRATETRLPDEDCGPEDEGEGEDGDDDGDGHSFFWMSTSGGRSYPSVGSKLTGDHKRGSSYARPSTSYTRGGVPKAGGSVPRGGFGGGVKGGGSGG